jgi:hypothetical protein
MQFKSNLDGGSVRKKQRYFFLGKNAVSFYMHAITRMKPYVCMTTISVQLAYTGMAKKLGAPTSAMEIFPVHAMGMPKPRAPASTTVRSTALHR